MTIRASTVRPGDAFTLINGVHLYDSLSKVDKTALEWQQRHRCEADKYELVDTNVYSAGKWGSIGSKGFTIATLHERFAYVLLDSGVSGWTYIGGLRRLKEDVQ